MKVPKHKFGSRLMERLWEERLQSSDKTLQKSKELITESKRLESACNELLKDYRQRKRTAH